MNRQDRQAARTPADLEYKYNFRKSFAQAMGIATDAQKQAKDAQSNTTALSGIVAGLSERADEIALYAKDIDENKLSQLSVKVDGIDLLVKDLDTTKLAQLSVQIGEIKAAVEDLDAGEIAELSVTVGEISAAVTKCATKEELDRYVTHERLSSELKVTTEAITASVEADYVKTDTLNGYVTTEKLSSDLELTSQSITASVEANYVKNDTLAGYVTTEKLTSDLELTSQSITASVEAEYVKNDTLNGYVTITEFDSRIEQTASDIKLEVSKQTVGRDDYDQIISMINLSTDTIYIGSNHAQLVIDTPNFKLNEKGELISINTNENDFLTTKGSYTKLTSSILEFYEAEQGTTTSIYAGEYLLKTKDKMVTRSGASLDGDFRIRLVDDSLNGFYFSGWAGRSLGQIRYRTANGGYFEIATDYDGANWAGMMLNAPTSRNNIIYGSWDFSDGEPSYGSDRNIKNSIADIPNEYSVLFDNLRPAIFKYNNGNSGRTHTGFIAQEVLEATENAGLTSMDFAGVCVRDEGTENELWTIRSGEIVALCVNEIQKLKSRIAQLEQA